MKLVFFLFLLLPVQLFAQNNKAQFSHKILEVSGDLNKDRLADKVVVTQDTIQESAPFRLQIFLAQPDGTDQLFVTTTNLIEPQYPNGRSGFTSGSSLADISIKNNVLTVSFDLIRGTFTYKFRLQNDNFELIGYNEAQVNGGQIYSIDFNLSTGIKIGKTGNIGSDKIISNAKRKVLIRPLPKIQDLIPFENDDAIR